MPLWRIAYKNLPLIAQSSFRSQSYLFTRKIGNMTLKLYSQGTPNGFAPAILLEELKVSCYGRLDRSTEFG